MIKIYRMRARQCRAAAATTQDAMKRSALERIARQWDALADQLARERGGSGHNVIPFERFARLRAGAAR